MNERQIFLKALEIQEQRQRQFFLDSVTKSDASLRQRLELLLNAHFERHGKFDGVAELIVDQASELEQSLAGSETGVDRRPDGRIHFHPDEPAAGENLDADEFVVAERLENTLPESINRYKIIRRLGAGGMGEVLLGRDPHLERNVAIKLIAPGRTRDPQWLLRFYREAKSASMLNHPNILTIYEMGQSGEFHFIATEFVEGITLREKLAGERLTIPQAIQWAIQLVSALSAAHVQQIIHRDLKPENIMLRDDGLLKILDFGLAKQIDSPTRRGARPPVGNLNFSSEPGLIFGTVRYMSPEQARGQVVDARSDIFSFGIVLFEMLTGKTPFDGASPSDMLVAILACAPKSLRDFVPDIPSELERITLKCLKKDAAHRYSSATELLSDLKRLEPMVLSPGSMLSQPFSGQADLYRPAGSGSPTLHTTTNFMDSATEVQGRRGTSAAASSDMPRTQYARSGEVNIAYQVLGNAAIDLVFVMGWVSHLEWFWKEPSFARFLRRLTTFTRLILFDKRGTGLSDKVSISQLPTLEQRMDDVRAVMDAVGSERAVLCGVSEGGPMCTLFAATYPGKSMALCMIGSYARRLWAPDYPWGPTELHRQQFLEQIRREWGGPVGIDERAPSAAHDPEFRNWWATYLRMGASPGAALALTTMNSQIDIRPILPTIQVPTLVIHRREDRCLHVDEGRYLAGQIPGAKFVELPGGDHLPFVGDQDAILDEIEEFLTGVRHAPQLDRLLATMLVIFVNPTVATSQENENPSASVHLQTHIVRAAELFRCGKILLRGDLFIITFDGPARAIRAAMAAMDSATRLGFRLKAGVHTGECEIAGDEVRGFAVEVAEQICQRATFTEILVSNTVKDLVVGSGLQFEEYFSLSLPGNSGQLAVHRAVR